MSESSPAGLLTFLFTDLEGSTGLWEQYPEAMQRALARHDDLLQQAIATHGGRIVKSTGDGYHAVFEAPGGALATALAAQQALHNDEWPAEIGPLKVRMGLHTGESEARAGDFYGPEVNLAARVMDLAHGGQVLLSEAAAALSRKSLPPACSLIDLGEHRLKGITAAEHIYQLHHPDLAADFPPLRSLSTFEHNLPRQLSSFIGRDKELAKVRQLLAESRLLTLLGPGGTGKTRLMLQVAEEVIEVYPDGVWLVELAPLTDPERIPEQVGAALRVQEQPGRELFDSLADFLRDKELLLLLDNVEHLVQGSAEFTESLLACCPKLKIMVTGREGLFIEGEKTFQVPSLSLPEPGEDATPKDLRPSESVQLFLERARAVRPDFALTEQNAAWIAGIIRRLDGIPLALELAAARLRMLTVEQISDRLDDRFRLLTGGRRTALPRHQTMQALIDWSWNLLEEEERILLRRLSVFSGGWHLEAAQRVASFEPLDEIGVFDNLEQLVNKSLITVTHPSEGEARYGMLESIRQYARQRLFEAQEGLTLRDRHAEYYVDFTQEAATHMRGSEMMSWVERLRRELDNCRAVVSWTLEERPEWALRLTGVLQHHQGYWMSPREAYEWLESAIAGTRASFEAGDSEVQPVDFIKALIALASISVTLGDEVGAKQALEEAITLSRRHGEDRLLAHTISMNNLVHIFRLTPKMIREGEEAVRISRREDFPLELAMSTTIMGSVFLQRGELEKGRAYLTESLQLAQAIKNPRDLGMVLEIQAYSHQIIGDLDRAKELFQRAIEKFQELGDQLGLARNRSYLAHLTRREGQLKKAESLYRETILAWQELGHYPALAHQLECFAYLSIARERYDRAAQLLGKAIEIRENLDAQTDDPVEIEEREQALDQLAEALGDTGLDRVLQQASNMSLKEAVSLALTGQNDEVENQIPLSPS